MNNAFIGYAGYMVTIILFTCIFLRNWLCDQDNGDNQTTKKPPKEQLTTSKPPKHVSSKTSLLNSNKDERSHTDHDYHNPVTASTAISSTNITITQYGTSENNYSSMNNNNKQSNQYASTSNISENKTQEI